MLGGLRIAKAKGRGRLPSSAPSIVSLRGGRQSSTTNSQTPAKSEAPLLRCRLDVTHSAESSHQALPSFSFSGASRQQTTHLVKRIPENPQLTRLCSSLINLTKNKSISKPIIAQELAASLSSTHPIQDKEILHSEILNLVEREIESSKAWQWGLSFLSQYGYTVIENGSGLVTLTRLLKQDSSVTITFWLDFLDPKSKNGDPPTSKEVVISILKKDSQNQEIGSELTIICNCTNYAISVFALGAKEGWNLPVLRLSTELQAKIQSYLDSLDLGADLARYVCDYTSSIYYNSNTGTLKNLKEFFNQQAQA